MEAGPRTVGSVSVGPEPLTESLSLQEGTQAPSCSMVHLLGIFQEAMCVNPSLTVKKLVLPTGSTHHGPGSLDAQSLDSLHKPHWQGLIPLTGTRAQRGKATGLGSLSNRTKIQNQHQQNPTSSLLCTDLPGYLPHVRSHARASGPILAQSVFPQEESRFVSGDSGCSEWQRPQEPPSPCPGRT